ncbi:MAG: NADH-quinone oxidoreductase subunit F [Spirochaetales bacterium]|jgi:NADP-reducing hydrogenase subunit HndC|nr:NADH-quinone oxidoreductase subunit F [Spirochaetales bacterium]
MSEKKLSETRITLRNVGSIDPENIDDSLKAGGYKALAKALKTSRSEVIDELVASSLRGRGGAGFSAGLKEQFTSDASSESRPVYIICNADEGEPGTFKDRIIMEGDPHLLIEGILIAAYAIGATGAFIYIRAEYYKSIDRVRNAIRAAKERGFITDIDIEVRLGAGSYLCGEELTLIESLEGKRGYPRIKPPFPSEVGLFGAPTLVNNVETLATIPGIIEKGSNWYTTLGTPDTPGTKIFNLSGDINSPGYYEVELGITLRELIYDFGKGITGGKNFKAALIGGAAGTFVDESVLDTPMGYDSLKEKGAVLGSGAVIVMAEDRSIPQMARSILDFFEHESCGKCVPCRIGMTQLVRMARESEDLDTMVLESEYMAASSLCPLGQSPVIPLRSLRRYFAGEFTKEEPA